MKIRDAIQVMQQLADQLPSGLDAEFKLVRLGPSGTADELVIDADNDVFDFQILRGDDEVVIEFD